MIAGGNHTKSGGFTCVNCITGMTESIPIDCNDLNNLYQDGDVSLFVGPGLIDLQINGVNGIDFNNPAVSPEDIATATRYLISKGITAFLPTVITNSDDNICQILQTICRACLVDPLIGGCVWGIHLEGPFISPVQGAKGAHDEKYIKAPDWQLFERFQEAAGGKIRLVTIAPEWEGAVSFIEKCREQRILVSIGHSMASTNHIESAVQSGVSLSTHLGNGVPLQLPRHPNIIWDQLAAEQLHACIIADGIHIPDSFIKVVMKNKGEKCLVVSDATCFAGMPPGEYENHIGGRVVLDHQKRVSVKNSPGILAGAAKNLLENVETLLGHELCNLADAWKLASLNVARVLQSVEPEFENRDRVIFLLQEHSIEIVAVIKEGKILFVNGVFK